jgi:hypothetical protein
MNRSSLASVRNPLTALPVAQRIAAAPPEVRELWRALCLELRDDARDRAAKAWRTHKAPMACYWKVVGVLAGHAARLAR